MILTGPEIRRLIDFGNTYSAHETMDSIHVDPYDPELVGPNSVDLRIGNKLLVYKSGADRIAEFDYATKVYRGLCEIRSPSWMNASREHIFKDGTPISPVLDMKKDNKTSELEIPEEGMVLWPGVLYLGRTVECIGSDKFVPIVEGRSSVGRLGVHVHVTAGFCDLGFKGTITLEIHVIHPVRIYPNVPICQAYFLKPEGAIELYKGRYQNQEEPTPSRFRLKKGEF